MPAALLRRLRKAPPPGVLATAAPPVTAAAAIARLARELGGLGRESAEIAGKIDDAVKAADGQRQAFDRFSQEITAMAAANQEIEQATRSAGATAAAARTAVDRVGEGVAGVVTTLQEVARAAEDISQIAMQTRIVAINASIEAARAGQAGAGFAVVAAAVNDLAQKVQASSKQITVTLGTLSRRVDGLAREIRSNEGGDAAAESFQGAFGKVEARIREISARATGNVSVCTRLVGSFEHLGAEARGVAGELGAARERVQALLGLNERLIEVTAEPGCATDDTPYIARVRTAAAELGQRLEAAIAAGRITAEDLFSERYEPIAGSNPPQFRAPCTVLTDELFPEVQEAMLGFSEKVVFCAAVDRTGYLPTHNRKFSHPQGADAAWNTAHCRHRRMFRDRTGLAAAKNERPFLLQTYRRDMGGGRFVVMKDLSAPIRVHGRHWGGLRFAYQF